MSVLISREDQPCLSGSKCWQAVKSIAIGNNRNADWLQKTRPVTDYRVILLLDLRSCLLSNNLEMNTLRGREMHKTMRLFYLLVMPGTGNSDRGPQKVLTDHAGTGLAQWIERQLGD